MTLALVQSSAGSGTYDLTLFHSLPLITCQWRPEALLHTQALAEDISRLTLTSLTLFLSFSLFPQLHDPNHQPRIPNANNHEFDRLENSVKGHVTFSLALR